MKQAKYFGVFLGLALSVASCMGQAAKAPDPQRQAALALEQQGKNAEAEAAWRAYLKTHEVSPEPYAHLGLLAARQEHYKEAVPLYRKALALGPQLPSVRLNLGLALFKSGQMKASIPVFVPLLKETTPDSPQAQQLRILIGMAHYGSGEYKEAIPYLQEATGHDAANLPLRLTLAHSCLWTKQSQCVMDTYKEILALNAESAEADMLAGEALDDMKDNEGSTKMFRAAVKANPKEPNVHFGLGYLLWTQKLYPEAASEFEAELANDPDHMQALLYLGDAKIQLNEMDAATALLVRVEKMNPAIELAHLDLGIIYSEADRKEDALRELLAADKLNPQDVNIHWRLGRLYRSMGKQEEAKSELDKAGRLNKAADEDLHNKIANAHAKPADAPPDAPPVQ